MNLFKIVAGGSRVVY